MRFALDARAGVVIALLLAAALRILSADTFPVWTDEGWSIWAAQAHVIEVVAADRHPPLYFAALTVWRELAGDSRLALRFLSVMAGLLTVALTYRLSADAFEARAGVFAAFVIAVLPAAVYYAQEVRHYGWLMLFTALSWLCLLRWLKSGTRAAWIGYLLSVAAALYTMYFAVFLLIAQAFAVLLAPVTVWRKLGAAVACMGAGALFTPWLYVILTQQADILSSGIAGFPGSFTVPDDFFAMLSILFGVPLLGIPALVLAFMRRLSFEMRALLIAGVGVFVIMFALSLRFQFLAPRTLIMLAPLVIAFAAGGLARLRWAGALIAGAWVLVMLFTAPIIQPRLNSHDAAAVIAAGYQTGDAVIIEAGWDDNAFAYEIARALPADAVIARTLDWTNDRTGGDPVVPNIMPILDAHDRVWIVQWLQASSVLPFLEAGGAGFAPVQNVDVAAGDYGERFFAPVVRVRLFAR